MYKYIKTALGLILGLTISYGVFAATTVTLTDVGPDTLQTAIDQYAHITPAPGEIGPHSNPIEYTITKDPSYGTAVLSVCINPSSQQGCHSYNADVNIGIQGSGIIAYASGCPSTHCTRGPLGSDHLDISFK